MNPPDTDSASFRTSMRGGVSTRLTMLTYLGAMASGCVLAFYGLILWRLDFAGGAVVAGTVAWLARLVLAERLSADETFELELNEGEITAMENESSSSGRSGNLVNLLQTWEHLEKARGSQHFDPWAVQGLRNDIRAAIREDPKLAQLFCTRS